jgi:DNA polymerase-3 subunit delta
MPVTLLYGDNHLEIDDAVRAVRQRFDDASILAIEGATVSMPTLAQAWLTAGLFEPERLVIVHGLHQRFKGTKGDSPEVTELRSLLSSLVPTTTVLLLSKDMAADHHLVADVRAVGGEARQYAMPRERDLPRWIQSRAKALGTVIEPQAAEVLAEHVGTNTLMLDAEMTKLATYAGEGERITPRMVEELVGSVTQETIFALVDAVAGREEGKALAMMHRQLESAGNPIEFAVYLIRMLSRQVRILLRIRLGLQAKRPRQEIIASLKLPRYYADRYFRQANQLSDAQLRGSFERLAALEYRLKSGKADPGTGLDLLVAEMCR